MRGYIALSNRTMHGFMALSNRAIHDQHADRRRGIVRANAHELALAAGTDKFIHPPRFGLYGLQVEGRTRRCSDRS